MEFIKAMHRRHEEIRKRRELAVRTKASREILAEARAGYVLTGNPLYVWLVWRRCRIKKARIPKWVRAYMDDAADQLCAWIDDPPAGNSMIAVAGAFKFKLGKKGKNPFTAIREAREAQSYLSAYIAARDRGLNQTAACNEVAAEMNTTIQTVRRRLEYFAEAVLGAGRGISDLEDQLRKERDWLAVLGSL